MSAVNQSRYVLAVRDFHKKAGHIINFEPQHVSAGVAVQRQRLIMEELGETAAAFHDHKLVDFADGLGDLLYVVAGTAVVYGIKVVDVWSDTLEKRWAPIFAPKICTYENAMQMFSKLERAVSRLFRAMSHLDLAAVHEFLCELVERIFEFAYLCGIPMAAVFDEVHSSNMSKNLAPCDGIQKYAQPHLVKGPGYHPPNIRLILGLPGEVKTAEASV